MTRRTDRVSHELMRELSQLIAEEVDDARLAQVTSVTSVQVSPDFSTAKIFVSALGGPEEEQSTLLALRSAAAMLRRLLADRMTLRRVPRLDFQLDQSIEQGAEMESLIDAVVAEDSRHARRRESGR